MAGCLLSFVGALSAQKSAQGLNLSFESLALAPPKALRKDSRVARRIALLVPRGEAPTPFMAPGPFRAEWSGDLILGRRDRYRFSFSGRGRFSLRIDGEEVLASDGGKRETTVGEELRLAAGSHALVAHYQSSLRGRGALRVFWQCRAFGREPIPIEALRHDPMQRELVLAAQRRRGRELFAVRRCLFCHAAENPGEMAMRDSHLGAPAFEGIGDRLEPAWMAAWISDPRALRKSARMPRVLRGSAEEVGQQAGDLAAYLATNHLAKRVEAKVGDPSAGGVPFAELGCIACHDFATHPEPAVISLGGVGAKFRRGALAAFLRDPGQHDPWTRMPDFRLSAAESMDLAAFLREHSSVAEPAPSGDADRGAALMAGAGCLFCHQPARAPVQTAPDLAAILVGEFASGCLAADEPMRGAAPDFGFGDEERSALRAFAATGMHALSRRSSAEFAARQIRERHCTACHSYDGAVDLWTEREHLLANLEIAERPQPKVSQFRPNLSYLGERLQVPWMRSFLAGEIPSPRPWLRARMPSFQKIASDMALGLAAQHGLGAAPEPQRIDTGLAAAGKKLVSAAGGFACTACHGIGKQPATSVFEVQGINFAQSAKRLRHDYFLRWMLDPPRIEPASKMPKFADDRGQTPFREILNGDARRQFEAIWVYLGTMR